MIDLFEGCCCGVREMHGISECSTEQALRLFGQQAAYHSDNFSHVFFTQAGSRRYGQNLAATITRLRLGKVVASEKKRNPNSRNLLKMWIWTVNWKAFRKKFPINDDDDDDYIY